jgi:hypothetical protein
LEGVAIEVVEVANVAQVVNVTVSGGLVAPHAYQSTRDRLE